MRAAHPARPARRAVVATVVLTAVFGLGYPALMTGFAQVAFPNQANGSLIKLNGKVVGSTLAAQAFTSPKYFHERPSATSPAYNAAATTFSNLGPTDPALDDARCNQQIAAILKLEGPYNPGPDRARHPRRRGRPVGLGDRPRDLDRLRRPAGAPHRGGAPPAARDRPAADQAVHRRALAGASSVSRA